MALSTRTGNYQIHEFDWLKLTLKASRFSYLDQQTGNVLQWKGYELKCKIIDHFHLTSFIFVRDKTPDEKKNSKLKSTSKL